MWAYSSTSHTLIVLCSVSSACMGWLIAGCKGDTHFHPHVYFRLEPIYFSLEKVNNTELFMLVYVVQQFFFFLLVVYAKVFCFVLHVNK